MYPADVVPFLLAHAWIAGVALVVGAFLGRVFPRALPYAVLGAGLGVSVYFAAMTWQLEGSLGYPLAVFAIAALVSLFLSAAVRYLSAPFEVAMFGMGWFLVLVAFLSLPFATGTVDAGLAFLAALACVAATEPLTRRAIRRSKAGVPPVRGAGGRPAPA